MSRQHYRATATAGPLTVTRSDGTTVVQPAYDSRRAQAVAQGVLGVQRTLPRVDYATYMGSPEWAQRRAAYYATHPRVCAACGATGHVDLHHQTYARLGVERDSDLVPLCEQHHQQVHALAGRRPGNRQLLRATRAVVRGP